MVDGVLVLDPEGVVRYSNGRALATLGGTMPTMVGRRLVESIVPAERQSEVAAAMRGLLAGPQTSDEWYFLEVQIQRNDGCFVWVDLRIGRIPFDQCDWLVAIVRDIDHQKRGEMALARAATTDELSGLANRRAFQHALEQHVDQPIVVAFVDVDYFKSINDRFGHLEGDRAIRFVAQRLAETLPDAICVARLGGDEFGVVLRMDGDLQTVVKRMEEVRTQFATTPFRGDGTTLTVSIGVAASEPDALSPRTLLTRADQSLYQAKTSGRNRVCVATKSLQSGSDAD